MKTEALKLALEALEYRGGSTWLKRGIAVEAIKEVLAQPQQSCYCPNCEALGKELAALKVQPQQEIDWKEIYEKEKSRADMWIAKYEADIKLLERAAPVTKQPPVAKPHEQEPMAQLECTFGYNQCQALDTAQKRRKPLTDDEIFEGWWTPGEAPQTPCEGFFAGVRFAEVTQNIKENT